MRKSLSLFGVGILGLSGLLFYAERYQRSVKEAEALQSVEEVLKAQNQAVAGRLFTGMGKAETDAAQVAARLNGNGKPKSRAFLADTALSEPDAPQWLIVGNIRVKAAGLPDDALLENALEAHLSSANKLTLHSTKGKNYLLIKGAAGGQNFVSAYVPEAFFSAFRSDDGIRVWVALKDGTIIYHPQTRFIGSSAANLKPVAAGIAALSSGGSAPFSRSYLGLDGRETLGSVTPLPAYGLLVGSEWPRTMPSLAEAGPFFFFGILTGLAGAMLMGLSFAGRREEATPRLFDEGRLDQDAIEYLEKARKSAEEAHELARLKDQAVREAFAERDAVLAGRGELEWRISVLEEFQDKILPQVTGKQVWSEIAASVAKRFPGLCLVFYRYSPSSFSLVPETIHGSADMPGGAAAFLMDTRIFIGNPSYLNNLLDTEAFLKWDVKRRRHMPTHQTEFRAYPIQCAGARGAILASYDSRMNANGELEPALELLEVLVGRSATFCDSLGRLLQSMYAKGNAWQTVAGAPDHAGNQSRPS